jgi:hypothetical protein
VACWFFKIVLQTVNTVFKIINHIQESYHTLQTLRKICYSQWIFYYSPQKHQILNAQNWDDCNLNQNQQISEAKSEERVKHCTFTYTLLTHWARVATGNGMPYLAKCLTCNEVQSSLAFYFHFLFSYVVAVVHHQCIIFLYQYPSSPDL